MNPDANHRPLIELAVMFLLDTNVVSELLRPYPEPDVVKWVEDYQSTDFYLSAISEAELLYGVAILPPGRRKEALASAIDAILREDFAHRILPFDSGAAREYASIASARHSVGQSIAPADCQIAAIARFREMRVVTRNVRDFEGFDIEVIDPWS